MIRATLEGGAEDGRELDLDELRPAIRLPQLASINPLEQPVDVLAGDVVLTAIEYRLTGRISRGRYVYRIAQ